MRAPLEAVVARRCGFPTQELLRRALIQPSLAACQQLCEAVNITHSFESGRANGRFEAPGLGREFRHRALPVRAKDTLGHQRVEPVAALEVLQEPGPHEVAGGRDGGRLRKHFHGGEEEKLAPCAVADAAPDAFEQASVLR